MFDFDFDVLEEGEHEELERVPCSNEVAIHVQCLDGTVCNITLQHDDSIQHVKESVEAALAIPWYEQRVCLDDEELSNRCRLSNFKHYGILNLSLIRVAPDKDEWISRVTHNPNALGQAPAPMKAHPEVVRAAACLDISAIAYAAQSLRMDRVFALPLVNQNGWALRYLTAQLQADREVVLAAVGSVGQTLKHAAADLKADDQVVLAAVRQDARAIMHAAPELLADPAFLQLAIQINHQAANFIPSSSGNHKEMELEADHEELELVADLDMCHISVQSARQLLEQQQALFLDCRTADEFGKSRIPGAFSFPHNSPMYLGLVLRPQQPISDSHPTLQQIKGNHSLTIIVYSLTGSDYSRCLQVVLELRRVFRARVHEFGSASRVMRLSGGLNRWNKDGLPVEGDQQELLRNSILASILAGDVTLEYD